MKMTSIEYMRGDGIEHICLDGEVAPFYDNFTVTFKNEKESFSVPIPRLVSVYIGEVEPAEVIPFRANAAH